MTVRGIEAIKHYMPPTKAKIDTNIKEEKGRATKKSETTNTMTSVQRYMQEWEQLLKDLNANPERMRDLAFNGDLKSSKFRSVYWALLLRVLSMDSNTWREQRMQQRDRYKKLNEEFIKNPHEIEVPDDDPLSQSTKSVWNQYFSDQELFAIIKQDVVRTFPGVDFFRKSVIQDAMINILFYYAREHPYMCYRQGMHEILAPILFIMYGDHQALLHFKEIAHTEIDCAALLDVLNPDFLEADAYSIFSRLMSSIESYYRVANIIQTSSDYFPIIEEQTSQVNSNEVEVIGQLNSIRDKILAKEDQHLHNYLLKLDIPLHIFGIRWLRLLFGREFPLLDLLVLWDAIFADSDRFDLPNYILVAMLIRIRDKLLLSDYTTCLTYLMRYPTNVDIHLILRHALHMQMPKKFDRPVNAFVYFTMIPDGTSHMPNLMPTLPLFGTKTNEAAPSSTARKTPLVAAVQPRFVDKVSAEERKQRSRTTSLSEAAKVECQIVQQQTINAADSAALARLKIGSERVDRVIMDGYSANSPELMRLELKNAQTVITIARNKLQSYLGTVRKHVTKNHTDELAQALDGIEELCSFLDVKFMFPLQTRAPIDQALEANEQQRQLNQDSKKLPKNTPTETRQKSATVVDESSTSSPSSQTSTNMLSGTAYEIPDNGFMFNSSRILGHLKEIEMIQIASDEKIIEPLSDESKNIKGLPIVDPLGQHEE